MCMTTHTNPILNTWAQAFITHHIKISACPHAGSDWITLPSVTSLKTLAHGEPERGFSQLWQQHDSRTSRSYMRSCQLRSVESSSLTCCPQVHEVTHHVSDWWLPLLNATPETLLPLVFHPSYDRDYLINAYQILTTFMYCLNSENSRVMCKCSEA